MSEAVTEETPHTRSQEYREMRSQLEAWEKEDFVMPGWQIVWENGTGGLVARFHMVHHPLPYTLGELAFEMYALGFADRRSAVMARTPRQEAAARRPAKVEADT